MFSLKYFVVLAFSLNLIFFSFLIIKFNPVNIEKNLSGMIRGLDSVPDDLAISIKKGFLFTNYNRPFFFWIDNNSQKKLLLVIDETASADKINIYNTYILLTSRELVTKAEPYSSSLPQIRSLKNIENFSVTKNDLKKIINILSFLKKFFYLVYLSLLPLVFLLLLSFSYLITFFYLFIISVIVFYTFKTYFHKNIHFRKTFQLSFHAATLPLIIDYALIILQPSVSNKIHLKFLIPTPLAFMILLIVFVFAAVYEAYQDKNLRHTSKI